jgi:protein-disulfide isomerase
MLAAALITMWMILQRRTEFATATPNAPTIPVEPVNYADAPILGRTDAPLTLIVYSDFDCPFCARFARDTMPDLQRLYVAPGHLAIAFKHFPLERIHPNARLAAEAAECAGRSGKFWQMHDKLFSHPTVRSREALNQTAAEIGVDNAKFEPCLAGDGSKAIELQVAEARRLGITSTPTVFLGTSRGDGTAQVVKRVGGAQNSDTFRSLIQEVMSQARR